MGSYSTFECKMATGRMHMYLAILGVRYVPYDHYALPGVPLLYSFSPYAVSFSLGAPPPNGERNQDVNYIYTYKRTAERQAGN